jgi:hypothetical protein
LTGTHAAYTVDGHQTTAALADVAENTQRTAIMALTGKNSRCQKRRGHTLTSKGGHGSAIHFDFKGYPPLHIIQPSESGIFFHKAPLCSQPLCGFLNRAES